MNNKTFTIAFYNAQLENIVHRNDQAQSESEALFWRGNPVVVVTQYLSAGNGVNLQYRPTAGLLTPDLGSF